MGKETDQAISNALSKIEQVERSVANDRATLQQTQQQTQDLSSVVAEEVEKNAEASERIQELESELAQEKGARMNLERKFDTMQQQFQAFIDQLQSDVKLGFDKHEDIFDKHHTLAKSKDEDIESMRNELQKHFEKARSESNSGISFVADDVDKKIKSFQVGVQEVVANIQKELANSKHANDQRCSDMDEEQNAKIEEMNSQINFLEAYWGKTIEWKLNMSADWQDNHVKAGRQTFWSPIFDLAGVRGLQIEAHVDPGTAPYHPCRVVCNLWAGGDVALVWRLSAGGRPSARFTHTFKKHGPCGTTWDLKKSQCDKHLVIGLELCEATISQKSGSSDMESSPSSTMVPSLIKVKKHVMHQATELVNASASKINSRLVKKVDWHIEDIASKAATYKQGEVIKSPTFGACGVDGFQIWLYPAGYNTSSPGFMGVFLYALSGTEVNVNVSISTVSRQIKHKFDGKCEPFGRANFAQVEKVCSVGSGDIVISLDFAEVNQVLGSGKSSAVRLTRTGVGNSMLNEVLQLRNTTLKNVSSLPPVLDGQQQRKKIADKGRSASPLRALQNPGPVMSHKEAMTELRQTKSLTTLKPEKAIQM